MVEYIFGLGHSCSIPTTRGKGKRLCPIRKFKQKSLELAFKRPRTTPATQSDVRDRPRRFLLEKMRLHLTAGHFMDRRVRDLSGCRSPIIWIVPAVRIFG